MGFWDMLSSYADRVEQDKRWKELSDRQRGIIPFDELVTDLVNHSLNCRCSGIAIPIGNTKNRYICLSCNSRFVHAKHPIWMSYELTPKLRQAVQEQFE